MSDKYRRQLEERIQGLQKTLDDDMVRNEDKENNQIIAWHLLEVLQTMDNEDLNNN